MKIIHICLSLGAGGAEKILVDTLPLYKGLGHDVSIIQLSSILEEKAFVEKMKEEEVPVITLSTKGFFNPTLLFTLSKTLKREKADVIHVHLFPAFYYISFLKMIGMLKPVVVFTEHSVRNGRSGSKLFSTIEPFIYKRFDGIVAISQNVKLMLLHYLPKLNDKVHLINNGVNIKKFTSAVPYDRSLFSKEYLLPENAILLMMTSRFSDPKDHNSFINCLEYLPLNYYIVFVGEGPEMEKCKTLSLKYNDRVKFLGFRMDVAQLMKMADINILSSWHEGFSCVTLEALASGKPFLGSDVTAINEIVPDSRFLFEAGNSKLLSYKIEEIITDNSLAQDMATLANQQVEKYDVNETVKQHIALYKRILNTK